MSSHHQDPIFSLTTIPAFLSIFTGILHFLREKARLGDLNPHQFQIFLGDSPQFLAHPEASFPFLWCWEL
ncbi:hypothetical protein AAHA92_22784 [Salvia divinorum]|uniref:Uncharacterized protein n=1 Tax=Salvia divinorum TaxID=28513 RepID=A0ABD1GPS7_SALDI